MMRLFKWMCFNVGLPRLVRRFHDSSVVIYNSTQPYIVRNQTSLRPKFAVFNKEFFVPDGNGIQIRRRALLRDDGFGSDNILVRKKNQELVGS